MIGLAPWKVHCKTPLMRAVVDWAGRASEGMAAPPPPLGVEVAVGIAVGHSTGQGGVAVADGDGMALGSTTVTLTGGAERPPEVTSTHAHPPAIAP